MNERIKQEVLEEYCKYIGVPKEHWKDFIENFRKNNKGCLILIDLTIQKCKLSLEKKGLMKETPKEKLKEIEKLGDLLLKTIIDTRREERQKIIAIIKQKIEELRKEPDKQHTKWEDKHMKDFDTKPTVTKEEHVSGEKLSYYEGQLQMLDKVERNLLSEIDKKENNKED